MTDILPESLLGPITAVPAVTGLSRFDIISDEAQDVKRLNPVPTVWGRNSGRPIYDRLPGVSEAYRLDYFGDEKQGLVYLDPRFGKYTGPGSLEVGRLPEDPSVLIIQSGTITWSYGQIPLTGLAIDLRSIIDGGAQDGAYLVGYYLNYTIPESLSYASFRVENYSLSNTPSLYDASSEANYHPVEFAFSEIDDGSWKPKDDGSTGSYSEGSSVTVDFTRPVTAERFILSGTELCSGMCALYSSEDAIFWTLESQISHRDGWSLNVSRDTPARYWKMFFWDGVADVTQILYTGEALFPNQRPSGPVSTAKPFLEDDQFAEIEQPHALLALVEVKDQKAVSVTDYRRTTSKKYEPVAKWLTEPWDTSLRSLLTDISQYSSRYMAPPSSCEDMYLELSSETFVIGDETKAPKIIFPGSIELEDGWKTVTEGELLDDPLLRGLRTDPNGVDLFATGFTIFQSNSSVTPSEVILLSDPVGPSDLATKVYVDSVLTPSLDNGKY